MLPRKLTTIMMIFPLIAIASCRSDAISEEEKRFITSDVETLCARMERGNISTWSQPVYASKLMRDLTMKADFDDSGEIPARCKIARTIKQYRKRDGNCSDEFVDSLMRYCGK